MRDDVDADESLDTFDWWAETKLRTIMTEPRRHELLVPGGGVVRLETADFLSTSRFSVKYLDAVGSFPPLPEKGAGKFLRALATNWFSSREVVEASAEAGDRGILLLDIETLLRSAPESDDGLDLERGSVILRPPAGALFVARYLLDRVRRACPVKITPSDFYAALDTLGCENQNVVRIGHWRGRVWLAPMKLVRPDDTAEDPSRCHATDPQANGTSALKHAVTPPRDGMFQ
jgi:hypothetical protein